MSIGRYGRIVVGGAALLAFACGGGDIGTGANTGQVQPSTTAGSEAMGMVPAMSEAAPTLGTPTLMPTETPPSAQGSAADMVAEDSSLEPAPEETPAGSELDAEGSGTGEAGTELDMETPTDTLEDPMVEEMVTEMLPEVPVEESDEAEPAEDVPPEDEPATIEGEEGVPMTDHCAAVEDWDAEWVQWEEEVLLLVNEARAAARSCGSQGDFEATESLTLNAALTCAARLHSVDMFERDFFDHVNPDGVEPSQRVTEAGYEWGWTGENIAYGYPSPDAVMEGWLDSDGHCSNIMSANYAEIGIGYYPGEAGLRSNAHFWTQNFGAPQRQGGGGGRGPFAQ